MTPRFSARQQKTRLNAVFFLTLFIALAFQLYRSRIQAVDSSLASQAETVDESLFVGLRHANKQEVQAALPSAAGKLTLLEFSSRLCHDCQRMKPVLAQLMPQHPQIYFKQVDALEDRGKSPALFRAFKPVSVPILVFIDQQGEIRNVLYNYQPPEAIQSALRKLEQQGKALKKPINPAKTPPRVG